MRHFVFPHDSGHDLRYRFDPISVLCAGLLCAGALIFLLGAHRDGLRGSFNFLLVAAVLLSLRQCDNILYAFQLGFPMTAALGGCAVYIAVKIGETETTWRAVGWTVLMLFALSAAMLTSAAAPACFIGAALPLLVSRRKQARGALVAVALAAIFWVGRYIVVILRHARPRPEAAGGAGDAVIGFFSVIGSGITGNRGGSVIAGALIVTTFIALVIVFLRERVCPVFLISIGFCSLAMAATVTAGRGGMGGIVPGRYSSFTLPLEAATLALLLLWIRGQPPVRLWGATVACSIVFGMSIASGTADAWLSGREAQAQATLLATMMTREAPMTPQELGLLNPGPPSLINSLVQFLKKERYNVFAM